jgi:hypothetical protein
LPPVGARTGNTGKVTPADTGKVASGNTGRVPPASPSGKYPVVAAAPAMPSGSHPAVGAAPAAAATPSGKSPVTTGSAVLTVRRNGGGAAGESFRVEGGLAVLGRFDPETGPVDVDLGRLPEAGRISRRHAELRRDEATGKWIIRDLGAGNGTFVRPKGESKFRAVQGDQPLSDGDEIGLGTARFEFRAG